MDHVALPVTPPNSSLCCYRISHAQSSSLPSTWCFVIRARLALDLCLCINLSYSTFRWHWYQRPNSQVAAVNPIIWPSLSLCQDFPTVLNTPLVSFLRWLSALVSSAIREWGTAKEKLAEGWWSGWAEVEGEVQWRFDPLLITQLLMASLGEMISLDSQLREHLPL